MRGRVALACALAVLIASIASAQFRGRRGYGRSLQYATAEDFDGSFQFCRIVYRPASNGDGGNWSVDYPRADQNLSVRLSELTKTFVGFDAEGIPKHLLLNLNSPELFHCPFIMMTEVGSIYLDEAEVKGLRDYLLKGGFLWVDDFWGTRAWQIFENQIRQVFPPARIPSSICRSTIRSSRVDGRRSPAADPSIGPGADPAVRPLNAGRQATPHARAILDDHGRVMIFITHNTDFGDSFEREGDNRQYFLQFSVPGYAVGVNVLLYAMSH
jgi:hypothetical protein